MRQPLNFLIFVFILSACDSSYDTSASIEVANIPALNVTDEEPESFIDKSLKLMYPNIGKYDLKIEVDEFDTHFKVGGNNFKVKFDNKGNWMLSEVGIRFKNKIPGKIREEIALSEFSSWFLNDKTLIETPISKQYKIEFQQGEEEWDIYYDLEGKIVRRDKEIKKTKNVK